jgi:hypothetical protein
MWRKEISHLSSKLLQELVLFKKTVTADGRWVLQCNPKTNCQMSAVAKSRVFETEESTEFKIGSQNSLICSFDIKGIINNEFVPPEHSPLSFGMCTKLY